MDHAIAELNMRNPQDQSYIGAECECMCRESVAKGLILRGQLHIERRGKSLQCDNIGTFVEHIYTKRGEREISCVSHFLEAT